eukprot:TRINITY_DN8054_c0_g1_i2.p1 TRINITY_DN8054_c0_g1~~TRINITY_DN8054_c0_g1_i2.p1  ORF type:complete len:449 (+),score=109.23 TRINITY_DN8054_c0_g1_i2:93-1349(+)
MRYTDEENDDGVGVGEADQNEDTQDNENNDEENGDYEGGDDTMMDVGGQDGDTQDDSVDEAEEEGQEDDDDIEDPENAPIDSNKFYSSAFYTEEDDTDNHATAKSNGKRPPPRGRPIQSEDDEESQLDVTGEGDDEYEEDMRGLQYDGHDQSRIGDADVHRAGDGINEGHSGAQEEQLVPIRIDLPLPNGQRLLDTFTWNLAETTVTPDMYARILCTDLDMAESVEVMIANAINDQLRSFQVYKPSHSVPDEFLILIRLDITVHGVTLRDQFEWDMASPDASPELFARMLCQDLGLFREFEVAIAHSIREQLSLYASLQPQSMQSHLRNVVSRGDKVGARPTVTAQAAVREAKDLSLWTPYVGLASKAPPAQPNGTVGQGGLSGLHPAAPNPRGGVRQSARLQSSPYTRKPLSIGSPT